MAGSLTACTGKRGRGQQPTSQLLPFCCAGMDFYVVLDRPGYRVSRRRRAHSRVGIQHRLTKEDAIKWYEPRQHV